MTTKHEPVIVFDLDGTLLRGNSFRLWFLYLVVGRYPHLTSAQRAHLSFQALAIMVKRKLNFCDHVCAKRQLQKIWASSLVSDRKHEVIERLMGQLGKMVRPCFTSILKDVREKRVDAVLATAAAEEYARPFGRRLGFTRILTSPPATSATDAQDNVGERKAENVRALLKELGWADRKIIVLTDHHEDMPLMQLCDYVLWFGPDDKMGTVQGKAPNAVFIACRTMSDAQFISTFNQME